jgi:hypothetical protein
MIKIEQNFNYQGGQNQDSKDDSKKKKEEVKKLEKTFAPTLNSDLFIGSKVSSLYTFAPIETNKFTFKGLIRSIKIFFINLINRIWWGPDYNKITKSVIKNEITLPEKKSVIELYRNSPIPEILKKEKKIVTKNLLNFS